MYSNSNMPFLWRCTLAGPRLFEGKDGFEVEVRVRLGLGLVG